VRHEGNGPQSRSAATGTIPEVVSSDWFGSVVSSSDFDRIAWRVVDELSDNMGVGEEFYRGIKQFIPTFRRQLIRGEIKGVLLKN
jgi:hypothetical protein